MGVKPFKNKPLIIAGKEYQSRLMVGTGKYQSLEQTLLAIKASDVEVVTVALRRTNIGQNKDEPNLLDFISPKDYTILPNTAGCFNAKDAIRTCELSRELLDGANLVKLEVLSDSKTLLPDVIETLKAAEVLVNKGFDVMAYTTDDLTIALKLEQIGCAAIMPLASPIGSGLGIQNHYNIQLIIDQIKKPVIVDAGVGTASDATIAMELGCDAILMNTAIAKAGNPIEMAKAMKHAVIAGRLAYLAQRMPKRDFASASSPLTGLID